MFAFGLAFQPYISQGIFEDNNNFGDSTILNHVEHNQTQSAFASGTVRVFVRFEAHLSASLCQEDCCFQKAEAELAYELQGAKEKQKIRSEEIEIDVVERKKQIDIEEKEIVRKEKELIASVRLPAEAEAYRMQTVAEGSRSVFRKENKFESSYCGSEKLIRH